MVNDGVEDLRCKYVMLIYTNYVSSGIGGGAPENEQKTLQPWPTPPSKSGCPRLGQAPC